ncbi:MAG: tetratricopeptide repeat protein [Sphingomonadaceae bacterium]|nr:tetratricopeptide repeat protein [Sphingomonadaceae bacterium]
MLSYGTFVWIRDFFGDGWWKQRLFNVAIHAGVSVLLYQLVNALIVQFKSPSLSTEQCTEVRSRNAAAAIGVLLFAVNPVSVYAVAYLIQRSILMATFFSVACLYVTLKSAQRGRIIGLLMAILAYAAAVLSKEHAVMLPIIAVSLYIMVARPSRRGIFISVIAMFALAGIGTVFLLQRYEGTGVLGQAFDTQSRAYIAQLAALSPAFEGRAYALSILNQMWLFLKYGAFWVLPNVLSMSVDFRPPFPLTLSSFPHILGLPIYLGIVGGSLYLMIRSSGSPRLVGYALFSASALFSTEFATVWIQDPFVLYRSYLWAAVGLPVLVALLFIGKPLRTTLVAGVLLVLVFSLLATERRLSIKTESAAWQDAASKIDLQAPLNAVGRSRALMSRGTYNFDKGLYGPALDDYRRAKQLGEPSGMVDYHIATILKEMGKTKEALDALNLAEKAAGTERYAFLIPYQKGILLYQTGRFDESVNAMDRALPYLDDPELKLTALNIRAKSHIRLHKYGAAIDDYRKLLQIDPANRVTNIELAIALGKDKKFPDAIALADKLLTAEDGADIRFARAIILLEMGKRTDALAEARQAAERDPNNPALQTLIKKLISGA